MNELEAITRAVELLGGPTNTSRLLTKSMGDRVAPNTVSDWVNKHHRCPERYAWHIQHLTSCAGEKITVETLCPVAFTINTSCETNAP